MPTAGLRSQCPDPCYFARALYCVNTYNLGAIVAHRLHLNQTRGMIHGGIYATRLAKSFEVFLRPSGYLLPQAYLNHQSMIEHHFTHATNISQDIHYNLVFSEVTHDIIMVHAFIYVICNQQM